MSVVSGALDPTEQAIVNDYNTARAALQAFIDAQTERPVSEQILRQNFQRELFTMAGAVNKLRDLAVLQGGADSLHLTVPAKTVTIKDRTFNNPARTTVKAAGTDLYWDINSVLRNNRDAVVISKVLSLTQLTR